MKQDYRPLFLFIYHKDDPVTRKNYYQLCKMEGSEYIVPISDCQSFLHNTFRCDIGPWPFKHSDSYGRVDGLIYKYVLEKSKHIRKHSIVFILEWDVWWNTHSKNWGEKLIKQYDIIGPEILTIQKDKDWGWFHNFLHLPICNKMCGIRPFSVVGCKPESLIKVAKYIRDNPYTHEMFIAELRFATICNILGIKLGLLPSKFCYTIKWHEWGAKCKNEECILHPIKHINQFI